jgi:hypothetical protein
MVCFRTKCAFLCCLQLRGGARTSPVCGLRSSRNPSMPASRGPVAWKLRPDARTRSEKRYRPLSPMICCSEMTFAILDLGRNWYEGSGKMRQCEIYTLPYDTGRGLSCRRIALSLSTVYARCSTLQNQAEIRAHPDAKFRSLSDAASRSGRWHRDRDSGEPDD